MPKWNTAPTEQQLEDAADSTRDSFYYKWHDGIHEYGKTFVGLPSVQLYGELLDSLVYVDYLIRMESETYDLLREVLDKHGDGLETDLRLRIKDFIDVFDKGMNYHINS